ncbi:hypothetical protein [Streptomyces pini]|uniref:Excreted virulence factor EspC, type VII ESX diderm n=1 Tax=Streptomyces pini TaxID=1520580 RepID=A0A1I3UBP5_9ACTN|nr:hypothetical protein [Streptomyces pini]SFJ80325.1 hypothetical protein SAMN05192584_101394 [Streptomyces pini]
MSIEDQRPTSTRLNELAHPGGGGGQGPGGDLAHSETQKKKAADYIERHLGPDTGKASILAEDDSVDAAGGSNATICTKGKLNGWEVARGLSHRLNKWERNSKRLQGRLDTELTGLEQTNTLFGNNETDTKASFDGVSPLYRSALSDYAPGAGSSPGPGLGRPAAKSPIADF